MYALIILFQVFFGKFFLSKTTFYGHFFTKNNLLLLFATYNLKQKFFCEMQPFLFFRLTVNFFSFDCELVYFQLS